jgi:hypothetical protein
MGREEQQARLDRLNGEGLVVALDAQPLDFLLAVFRDARQPMNRRLKAAEISAKYCHPQLSALAVTHFDNGFGEMLDRAVAASNAARLEPPMRPMRVIDTHASPAEVSSERMGKPFQSVRRRF